MPQPTLEAKNIEKHFKSGPNSQTILQSINLKLLPGEVLGLLGPNHSGKSLLLSILAGKVPPSAGEVSSEEASPCTIGLMPEQSIFPDVFRVKDIFAYHQQFYECRAKTNATQPLPNPQEWLADTPIGHAWRKRITELDTVDQRWLSFYLATYGTPKAVLLDEPFRFFDENGIAQLNGKIAELKAQGVAVAVASHDVGRLREVSDEMVILHGGKIVHRAKKILPDQDTYFCLHVSGASQETFDELAKDHPPWQALFFEGFLARVFFSSYGDCYRMMQEVIARGMVIVKFDTEGKPHLDQHNLEPHIQMGGS